MDKVWTVFVKFSLNWCMTLSRLYSSSTLKPPPHTRGAEWMTWQSRIGAITCDMFLDSAVQLKRQCCIFYWSNSSYISLWVICLWSSDFQPSSYSQGIDNYPPWVIQMCFFCFSSAPKANALKKEGRDGQVPAGCHFCSYLLATCEACWLVLCKKRIRKTKQKYESKAVRRSAWDRVTVRNKGDVFLCSGNLDF